MTKIKISGNALGTKVEELYAIAIDSNLLRFVFWASNYDTNVHFYDLKAFKEERIEVGRQINFLYT